MSACPGAPREKDTQYLGGGEGPRHAEPIRGTLNYADLLPKGLIEPQYPGTSENMGSGAFCPLAGEETANMTCVGKGAASCRIWEAEWLVR